MPELDSIRGLAILGVLFYHGLYWARDFSPFTSAEKRLLFLMSAGQFGVSLFFVLSGFLITGLLIDSRNRIDYYKRFYIRRALRILPAYYANPVALGYDADDVQFFFVDEPDLLFEFVAAAWNPDVLSSAVVAGGGGTLLSYLANGCSSHIGAETHCGCGWRHFTRAGVPSHLPPACSQNKFRRRRVWLLHLECRGWTGARGAVFTCCEGISFQPGAGPADGGRLFGGCGALDSGGIPVRNHHTAYDAG